MNEDELHKRLDAEMNVTPNKEDMAKLMGDMTWRNGDPAHAEKEGKDIDASVTAVRSAINNQPLLKRAFILQQVLGLTIQDIAEINIGMAAGSIRATLETLTQHAASGSNTKLGGDDGIED